MLETLILTTITAAAAVAVGVAAMVISPTVALTTIAVGIITSGGIIYDAKMNSMFNKKITRMENLDGYNEQYVISDGWKRKWYYTTKERDKILGDCFRTIRPTVNFIMKRDFVAVMLLRKVFMKTYMLEHI